MLLGRHAVTFAIALGHTLYVCVSRQLRCQHAESGNPVFPHLHCPYFGSAWDVLGAQVLSTWVDG